MTITGPVHLANAQLANFNLKSKLGALRPLSGLGGGNGSDTVIQTLSANLRVDPSGTNADNLNLVVPTIGTITGNRERQPHGSAQLQNARESRRRHRHGDLALTSITGGGKSSKGGIPFKITGTTSNPVFLPDLSGAAGNMVKGVGGTAGSAASAATGVLGGLFGKRKHSSRVAAAVVGMRSGVRDSTLLASSCD